MYLKLRILLAVLLSFVAMGIASNVAAMKKQNKEANQMGPVYATESSMQLATPADRSSKPHVRVSKLNYYLAGKKDNELCKLRNKKYETVFSDEIKVLRELLNKCVCPFCKLQGLLMIYPYNDNHPCLKKSSKEIKGLIAQIASKDESRELSLRQLPPVVIGGKAGYEFQKRMREIKYYFLNGGFYLLGGEKIKKEDIDCLMAASKKGFVTLKKQALSSIKRIEDLDSDTKSYVSKNGIYSTDLMHLKKRCKYYNKVKEVYAKKYQKFCLAMVDEFLSNYHN